MHEAMEIVEVFRKAFSFNSIYGIVILANEGIELRTRYAFPLSSIALSRKQAAIRARRCLRVQRDRLDADERRPTITVSRKFISLSLSLSLSRAEDRGTLLVFVRSLSPGASIEIRETGVRCGRGAFERAYRTVSRRMRARGLRRAR